MTRPSRAAGRAGASGIPWARIVSAMTARLAAEGARSPLPSVSAVALQNNDPYRVLVATMISLRTKDEVTRRAADSLLAAAPTPHALAALPEARIARLIYPAGFYRTKAKSLRATARALVEQHAGAVPSDMERLLSLTGVGRKTANLVLNLGFGLPGICVDTHVHRISNRMGWVATTGPEQTERALMEILPKRYWITINELLVRYGQRVCTPLSPHCSTCPVSRWCARAGVGRSR